MVFKMKGYNAGEGTGSSAAFKKASAFKEVPGGGPSVQDRYEQRMQERADAGEETKTHKLFGRTWTKTKKFDPVTGRKIGKTTVVTDKEGKEIGRGEKGEPTSASTRSTASRKPTGSYVKPGGKATGSMKDYKIGSLERKAEYDARGWKYDETIKGYNKDGSKIETETETKTETDTGTDTTGERGTQGFIEGTEEDTAYYENLSAAEKQKMTELGMTPSEFTSAFKNYKNPRDYKVFNMGNEASPSFKKKKKRY